MVLAGRATITFKATVGGTPVRASWEAEGGGAKCNPASGEETTVTVEKAEPVKLKATYDLAGGQCRSPSPGAKGKNSCRVSSCWRRLRRNYAFDSRYYCRGCAYSSWRSASRGAGNFARNRCSLLLCPANTLTRRALSILKERFGKTAREVCRGLRLMLDAVPTSSHDGLFGFLPQPSIRRRIRCDRFLGLVIV